MAIMKYTPQVVVSYQIPKIGYILEIFKHVPVLYVKPKNTITKLMVATIVAVPATPRE